MGKKAAKMTSELARSILWRRGEIDFLLHEGQMKILRSIQSLPTSTRQAVILCARRFGKSYLGIVMALMHCIKNPNAKVGICAPSKEDAQKIIVPLIKQVLVTAPSNMIHHKKSELLWEFNNGSCLTLGGFDTANESFRGQAFDLLMIEESGFSRPDNYSYTLRSVLLPTLAHSRGRIYHLTTPSKVILHPLHTETIPQARTSGALWIFTIDDNPLLDADAKKELIDAMGGPNSIEVRRELYCEIVRDDRVMIVPDFDVEKHTYDGTIHYDSDRPYFLSIDFGGTRDKTVSLLGVWRHGLRVISERSWEPNTPTVTIVNDIKEQISFLSVDQVRIYADAPGQLITDLSTTYDLRITLPPKDDRDAALGRLTTAFKNDQIKVHTSCTLLIETLLSGRFNGARTDFERTWLFGHCDAIAALLYLWRVCEKVDPVPDVVGEARARPDLYFVRPTRSSNDILVDAMLGRRKVQ